MVCISIIITIFLAFFCILLLISTIITIIIPQDIPRFSSSTFLLVLYAVPSFLFLLLPEAILFRRCLKKYSNLLLLKLHLQCQVKIEMVLMMVTKIPYRVKSFHHLRLQFEKLSEIILLPPAFTCTVRRFGWLSSASSSPASPSSPPSCSGGHPYLFSFLDNCLPSWKGDHPYPYI